VRVGPGPLKGEEDIVCWRRAQVAGRRPSRTDQARRQTTGRGMERNLLRIVLNWSSHGHALGRCRVLLPPEVVIRPGMFKHSRAQVLVVMGRRFGPEADATTQRPRLWAMTLRVIQTALAQKRPDGRWFTPTPYFKSRITSSTTAWRR